MQIYMDNAATTPISDAAANAVLECMKKEYGNPSSIHQAGQAASKALESSRRTIARLIGAEDAKEIYFTSGGTEADNWAIRAAAELGAKQGKRHMISTRFEHHAVLHTLERLERQGFEVTLLEVHGDGLVRPGELEKAIRKDTALVTVMYANNEIGTVQPVAELGGICGARGVWFHTDAVQAAGHIPLNLRNVDMLSLSAHKFGGPKGVGALYLRKGVKIPPLTEGGGHERGLRSGTENVAGIVGLAKALALASENLEADSKRVARVSGIVKDGLSRIPYAHLTGHPDLRLPGTVSFVFEAVEGESLVLGLDAKGVAASSGSACSHGSLEPSHVLLAVGLSHEVAHGSLRLSFGYENTPEEAEYVVKAVTETVAARRAMSPLWDEAKNAPTERFWRS